MGLTKKPEEKKDATFTRGKEICIRNHAMDYSVMENDLLDLVL